jgi:hypothetical protein
LSVRKAVLNKKIERQLEESERYLPGFGIVVRKACFKRSRNVYRLYKRKIQNSLINQASDNIDNGDNIDFWDTIDTSDLQLYSSNQEKLDQLTIENNVLILNVFFVNFQLLGLWNFNKLLQPRCGN